MPLHVIPQPYSYWVYGKNEGKLPCVKPSETCHSLRVSRIYFTQVKQGRWKQKWVADGKRLTSQNQEMAFEQYSAVRLKCVSTFGFLTFTNFYFFLSLFFNHLKFKCPHSNSARRFPQQNRNNKLQECKEKKNRKTKQSQKNKNRLSSLKSMSLPGKENCHNLPARYTIWYCQGRLLWVINSPRPLKWSFQSLSR